MRVHIIHDHPLDFVYPDLLVAVCETSYGIRGYFIYHTVLTICLLIYLFLSEVQRPNLFS
jgi:hypothetical protein